MTNELFENLNEFNKTTYDAIKGLYEINTNMAVQIAEQNLACANLYVESAARQLKLASEAKGYAEIINGQTELVSDISKKSQGIACNTVDIFNESKDEISAWLEKYTKETVNLKPVKNRAA